MKLAFSKWITITIRNTNEAISGYLNTPKTGGIVQPIFVRQNWRFKEKKKKSLTLVCKKNPYNGQLCAAPPWCFQAKLVAVQHSAIPLRRRLHPLLNCGSRHRARALICFPRAAVRERRRARSLQLQWPERTAVFLSSCPHLLFNGFLVVYSSELHAVTSQKLTCCQFSLSFSHYYCLMLFGGFSFRNGEAL